MRKVLVSILGLIAFGVSTQLASAKPNCGSQLSSCMRNANRVADTWGDGEGEKAASVCNRKYDGCTLTGQWGSLSGLSQDAAGHPANTRYEHNPEIKDPAHAAGSSRPKKTADGKTQRTADGKTVMVDSKGHEWYWNGETVTVPVPGQTKSYHIMTTTVMVGDPAVTLNVKFNGQDCKASLPSCAAAYKAYQAQQHDAVIAQEAAAKKAAKKNKQDAIDHAKDPGGILQQGGTKIIKEDVDIPVRRPSPPANAGVGSAHPVAQNPVSPAPTASSNAGKKPAPALAPVSPPPAAAVNAVRNQVGGHQGSGAYHAQ